MEKTGAIQVGVTPEVKPVEKKAGCCRKLQTVKEKIRELEDDAVARLAKAASKQG